MLGQNPSNHKAERTEIYKKYMIFFKANFPHYNFNDPKLNLASTQQKHILRKMDSLICPKAYKENKLAWGKM